MNDKRRIVSLALGAAMLWYGGRLEGSTVEESLSPAEVTGDPVELEAFRADLENYITEMNSVAEIAGLPSDLAESLERLPSLTTGDLSILRAAFARRPNWKALPRSLALLQRPPGGGGRVPFMLGEWTPQITPNDCAAAISWGYTQTDIEIAADVALAADVILEAIPQDVLGSVARGIAVAVWAVPQGVLRGFEHLYNIAQVCQSDTFESSVNSQLSAIVNNDNANRDQIINNDNSNTTTVLNHTSANTLQIITNNNSNTENILNTIGANAEQAEARQIEDNLVQDSCPAWMSTPEYADTAQTVRLGGRLEKVVGVIQRVIDDARALQSVHRFELACAQHSLDESVEKAGRRPPFRARRVCDLLLDAYEKATSRGKGHHHGHSDHDGHRGKK